MRPKIKNKSMSESLGMSKEALTPTTMRNLTQILESDNCLQTVQSYENTESQDIPTIVCKTFASSDAKGWQGGVTTILSPNSFIPQPALDGQLNKYEAENQTERKPSRKKTVKKTGGGRKPNNPAANSNLSPEEAAKLNHRRERNKLAAARCRKRRVDQTNDLLDKVEVQEEESRRLQEEISKLQDHKAQLKYMLETHKKGGCKYSKINQSDEVTIKTEPVIVESIGFGYSPEPFRPRPSSLLFNEPSSTNIGFDSCPSSINYIEPKLNVSIDTPSSILPTNLGFDSLLPTSSGLTPVSTILTPILFQSTTLNTPTCSSQQRTFGSDKPSTEDGSPNLVSL